MKDKNSFKMVLWTDDRKVYIDLSKGYDHVSNSLHKLGYYPYDIKFSHVRFKFTHQSNEMVLCQDFGLHKYEKFN